MSVSELALVVLTVREVDLAGTIGLAVSPFPVVHEILNDFFLRRLVLTGLVLGSVDVQWLYMSVQIPLFRSFTASETKVLRLG